MKNLPNITSLRFILALLVILFHIPQFCSNRGFPFYDALPIFHKGTEAVYVFFSLSGFLIIRLLYIEKAITNAISLRNFYQRRILRIFPLYYFVLLFGLLYYNFILEKFGFEYKSDCNLSTSLLLGGSFFANILATKNPGGIIEILWSIGIEEQFYLFIAPLIFLISKNKIVNFLILFSGIYFLIYHFVDLLPLSKYHMLYFYFSVSGAFSILSYQNRLKIPPFPALLIIGLSILYFTTNWFSNYLPDILYHLFSMLLFPLLLCVLVEKPVTFLENNWMKYLGKISYGIYMLHAMVMQLVGLFFMKLVPSDSNPILFILGFNFLVILLTILFAHLSYTYYESYFLKKKKRVLTKSS